MISPYQDNMATHSHLLFLSPCVFCIPLASVERPAQVPRHQHQGALVLPSCSGHCHQAVFTEDLLHMVTARALPPWLSCTGEFLEPRFRCSWAPGKGTKEPFSSPASLGVEGEGKRKEQCLQNTTMGRKFSSGFLRLGLFLSLFLFLKRADTASGQFKNNQALASHICHGQPFLG